VTRTAHKTPTPAEASRHAHVEAEAKLTAFRAGADQAAAHLTELRQRLDRADDTVTPAELAAAAADIDARWPALIRAAERGVRRTLEAIITDDLRLAELVAGALAPLGVTMTVTSDVAAVPADAVTPALIVAQRRPHEQDPAGYVSGSVRLTYRRDALHRALDLERVASLLEQAGVLTEAAVLVQESASAGVEQDSATIAIRKAWLPGLPVIDAEGSPDASLAARWLGHLAGRAAGSFATRPAGVVTETGGDAGRPVGLAKASQPARVAVSLVASEPYRKLRVSAELGISSASIETAALGAALERVIRKTDGTAVDYLGRCVGVEIGPSQAIGNNGTTTGLVYPVEFVFASEVAA
jgi:hypothetical protein